VRVNASTKNALGRKNEQGFIITLVAVFMLGVVGAMAALSIDLVTIYTALARRNWRPIARHWPRHAYSPTQVRPRILPARPCRVRGQLPKPLLFKSLSRTQWGSNSHLGPGHDSR